MTSKRTRVSRNSLEEDENEGANAERYLLTYADLITLLLGLFIILYAVSNIDAGKYEKMMENLGEFFGNELLTEAGLESNIINLSDENLSLKSSILKFIDEYDYSNNIRLIENERGITISILDNILFESGNA
ncbi:MAG: flagellar motor protein MotB, partial [Melioribacteraceae bacterium]|nr:flagellar motor protein MotB [Melioribacteraceae bacterium]